MVEFDHNFFKQKYRRENFISFLLNVFLGKELFVKEKDFAYTDYKTIAHAQELATHDGLDLHIIEIEHSTNDARIAIARDAFSLMADHNIDKALVVFINNTNNYRFSLLMIDLDEDDSGKIKKIYSNPRRYSFFLGEDAKVNTPYQQLIKRGKIKDFDDLLSRFSLEVVNKEFYKTLVGFFNRLVGDSNNQPEFILPVDNQDVRKEFAVRLIGRIIFTWFLKQKNQIRVPLYRRKYYPPKR